MVEEYPLLAPWLERWQSVRGEQSLGLPFVAYQLRPSVGPISLQS